MVIDVLKQREKVVGGLRHSLQEGKAGLQYVPMTLAQVIREQCWQERNIGGGKIVRFDRFEQFVTTPPLEGLGATVALLQNLVRDEPIVLDLLDQALQGKQGERTDLVSNGNEVRSRPVGNTRTYALRKLRKDRPDLHADVLAGKCSAHAAMRAAGFRRTASVLEQLQKLWTKATPQERGAFLSFVRGDA